MEMSAATSPVPSTIPAKASTLITAYRTLDEKTDAHQRNKSVQSFAEYTYAHIYVEAVTETIRHILGDEARQVIAYAQEQRPR